VALAEVVGVVVELGAEREDSIGADVVVTSNEVGVEADREETGVDV
jgi:hypothetical protein